ncbi:hypothetical protein EON83_29640 [bacterium]|nr:MAG: hypothetical protein EON83_29640 [bacterium]
MFNRVNYLFKSTFVVGALWAASGSAHAATCRWVGANNGAWNLATNWSTKTVPTAVDSVVIDANKIVAVPADVTVTNLTVGANAEIRNIGKIKVTGVTSSLGLFTGAGTLDIPAGATAVYDVTAANLLATTLGTGPAVVFAPINNNGSIVTKVAQGCRVDFASINNSGSTDVTSDGTVTFKDIKNAQNMSISASGTLTLSGIDNATGASLSIAATTPPGLVTPVTGIVGNTINTATSLLNGSLDTSDPIMVKVGNLANHTGGVVKVTGAPLGRYFSGQSIINEGNMLVSGAQTVLSGDVSNSATGILTLESDARIFAWDGTAPKLSNAGKLVKTAGSDVTLSVDIDNIGLIVVENGTMHVRVKPGKVCKQNSGTTTLEGGVLSVENALSLLANGTFEIAGGTLDGIGTINGNVVNSGGHVSPGHSPGTVTINGNYTQTSGGVLDMEIGGTDPGTSYDQMVVNGTANLGGTLNWVRWQGFVPQDGDVYVLFTYYSKSGNFASFVDKSPVAGISYDTTLTPTDYEVSCYGDDAGAAPVVAVATPTEGSAATTYTKATGTSGANGSANVTGVTCRLYRYNNPVTGVAAGFWAGGSNWTTSGTATNERAATGTTSWSFTFPTLVAGRYSLRATATNAAGTTTQSSTVSFWVDPNAPSALTVSTPANNASITSLTSIEGTTSDASDGSGVTQVQLNLKRSADNLFWSGSAWTSSATALSTTLSGTKWTRNSGLPSGTGLKTGSYVITAIASDRAGNAKTITSNFTVTTSTKSS